VSRYYKGKPAGISRDYEKAFKFFSLAAEGGGCAEALYYMGTMLIQPSSSSSSYSLIGIMFLRGQGTKANPSQAADCFQRAADAGHVLAQ
jgi:TPR repeat protein